MPRRRRRRPTRLRAKLSSAVPLWNKTVTSVVVVEKRSPTFLLITTHRDSRIYRREPHSTSISGPRRVEAPPPSPPPGELACSADLTESRVSMFSCRKEAMSFQSMMSSSQLCCLCIVFWPRGRPEWVTFWRAH